MERKVCLGEHCGSRQGIAAYAPAMSIDTLQRPVFQQGVFIEHRVLPAGAPVFVLEYCVIYEVAQFHSSHTYGRTCNHVSAPVTVVHHSGHTCKRSHGITSETYPRRHAPILLVKHSGTHKSSGGMPRREGIASALVRTKTAGAVFDSAHQTCHNCCGESICRKHPAPVAASLDLAGLGDEQGCCRGILDVIVIRALEGRNLIEPHFPEIIVPVIFPGLLFNRGLRLSNQRQEQSKA